MKFLKSLLFILMVNQCAFSAGLVSTYDATTAYSKLTTSIAAYTSTVGVFAETTKKNNNSLKERVENMKYLNAATAYQIAKLQQLSNTLDGFIDFQVAEQDSYRLSNDIDLYFSGLKNMEATQEDVSEALVR